MKTLTKLLMALALIVSLTPVKAQLPCRILNGQGQLLLPLVAPHVAGRSHRINRRKTFLIRRVNRIRINNCRATVYADVTLKRRRRRDGHGTMVFSGNLSLPAQRRACFSNIRIHSIRLSRTLRIGERFYKWIANLIGMENQCFNY